MPQLLLELLSEEIPARMQANAARDLERMARERLAAEGLLPEALKTFGGARRLTLVAEGLPDRQPDRHEELKGPKTSAPDQALDGFLRKTGLTREELVEKDGVWFATVHKHGRPTAEIVAEMVQGIVRDFPWPKSMVSGVSKLRWVRPLRRIVCVFDGAIVPFDIEGIPSGATTQGHRFMIRTSMRVHQRYFAVRNPTTGKLAPHFVTIANIAAKDGGKVIATGNAKVLSARLSDARFFWNEDRKVRLEDRLEKLKGVTFHAKLGSMYDRVQRIVSLAEAIAPFVRDDDATRSKAAEAASLCKADLVSGVVGEFPELQGIMGGYYAEAEGLDPEVVDAIRHHYKPQGPNDDVPVQSVAATVALADKLDTLVSFFGIGEKPTGSRDPFALRRAALGVIRIVLSTRTRLPLKQFGSDDLLAFFADRLKVQLREEGQRHDLVDAVFALGDDDLVRIVARVQALGAFLATDDGANLLAGYKRAVNILRAEEKKGPLPTGVAAVLAGQPAEEAALIAARDTAEAALSAALAKEDFVAAMQALAALRAPVDAFFDKVLVNSDVEAERENRLRLLIQVRDAMGRVADFSQVTG